MVVTEQNLLVDTEAAASCVEMRITPLVPSFAQQRGESTKEWTLRLLRHALDTQHDMYARFAAFVALGLQPTSQYWRLRNRGGGQGAFLHRAEFQIGEHLVAIP